MVLRLMVRQARRFTDSDSPSPRKVIALSIDSAWVKSMKKPRFVEKFNGARCESLLKAESIIKMTLPPAPNDLREARQPSSNRAPDS